MASYAALIGDIRGSRQLDDRAEAQRSLREALASVTQLLGEAVEADLVITTGDEFQGLFARPNAAIEALSRVDEHLPELAFRFGIGWGGLTTDVEPEAVGMDGPCFHRARAALDDAPGTSTVGVAGVDEALDAHAATVLGLVQAKRSDWTPTQCRYALAFRDADTQQAIAERFDRSKSSVSESLSRAHVRAVHAAETSIGHQLDQRTREADR